MNTSAHPAGLYQSSPLSSSSSTLRPRAPRLISYVEDDTTVETTAISTSSLSTPPRFPSRGVSPNTGGSRTRSTDDQRDGGGANNPRNRTASDASKASAGRARAGGSQGLWESWSSIQGLASTLLGDVHSPSKDKTDKPFKTPVWMKQDKRYGPKRPTAQWGPSSEPSTVEAAITVPGAIEERQAMVQAKKREVLLLASASESRDGSGRYKRRDSDAGLSSTNANGLADSDADALVYLHKVQKNDTLAGVVIKYNCQAEVFRKINRFWPNDNIQTRSHVVIPLEGCTVRGRKVDSPYLSKEMFDSGFGLDQLSLRAAPASSPAESGSSAAVNGTHVPVQGNSATLSTSFTSNPSSLITSMSQETEFRHDSWVMLPNFKEAVEIVRVPRRALGYFPRPRRKSNATLTDASTPSTPKTSFDMLRHPPTHAAQTTASLNTSPVRRPGVTSRLSSTSSRQRSSSVTGGSFAEALRGPGGVGNLRGLRTEAARPGPAEDPLNRQFAQYLPDLLPPLQQTPPLRSGFSLRLPTPRAATPRASTDSMRSTRSNSNGSGLGEVGGAIEGWVRKIAGAKSHRGATVDKMGDLIELETNTEDTSGLDSNGDGSSTGGNGQIAAANPDMDTITLAQKATMTASASTSASVSATEEALLNERFPMRGRLRNANAYSRMDSSSGKDKNA
ncbi:hypothetical protein A1O3_07117 [Capronia epimyces CBS 606.96]|uniref:LysM domain-containing protein n=1 Tax=Capronia epimyces CBS 606.96 TaxID=1182542 RepID=W9XKY3_9EURO|nr:uncharacterized protein A1O3_07117 [Capronia epimyces CBS 606.96]EXJ80833.1 hypothetical protein A1O3_07117 [Capronia epimyces CBS 606.96]